MINKIRLFPGTHQVAHPGQFTVDRTNLFVGRVELHNEEDWNEPSANLMSLTAGSGVAQAVGLTNMASGGTTPPMCIGVERRYDTANSLGIYTYTYEGIATQHLQKFIEFELEFTMTQEDIVAHPNYKDINATYGPYDTLNRLWPQYISAQSQATGLQAQSTDQGAVQNPMLGISSFYVPGLMYRISYSDIDVDTGLFNGIGGIVDPPSIGTLFEQLQSWVSFPGNRNWLKMAPKVRQRGSCLQITEEYMMSGPRGWSPIVYSGATATSGGGSGGGGPLGGIQVGL